MRTYILLTTALLLSVYAYTTSNTQLFDYHLSPKLSEVKAIQPTSQETPTDSSCSQLSGLARSECWKNLIDTKLNNKGVAVAFDTLAALYGSQPSFTLDCHTLTHDIGKYAYQKFSQGKDFDLSAKSSYCGYGFYHGFMEEMLHTTGTLNGAVKFCALVGVKLKDQTSDAEGACYHGIGHGVVADLPDPSLWGKAQAIIDNGLHLCEQVANHDQQKLFRCATGVFNAYEIAASANKYNLHHDLADPLGICRKQKETYQRSCYTQLALVALTSSHHDFKGAVAFADLVQKDDLAIQTMQSLVVEMVKDPTYDFSKQVIFCRNLSPRFQVPCISFYGEGLMKYGPPTQEYLKATAFCGYTELSDIEHRACFDRILSLLSIFYTKEKALAVCKQTPIEYQWEGCRY